MFTMPSPTVKRLSRSAPLAEIIQIIERDGCVIISDFTTKDKVDQAKAEIKPFLGHNPSHKVGGMLSP
jgi:hypothetical protein